MLTKDVLLRLYDHQSRILARIDASTALLRLGPVEARVPLARARWAMARMLREYQLFKHTEIFDPVIADGDDRQVAAARRLRDNCAAAGDGVSAHVERWTTADVTAQWASYCRSVRQSAGEMQAHIARERSQVEALLAGTPSTRPLVGRGGRGG